MPVFSSLKNVSFFGLLCLLLLFTLLSYIFCVHQILEDMPGVLPVCRPWARHLSFLLNLPPSGGCSLSSLETALTKASSDLGCTIQETSHHMSFIYHSSGMASSFSTDVTLDVRETPRSQLFLSSCGHFSLDCSLGFHSDVCSLSVASLFSLSPLIFSVSAISLHDCDHCQGFFPSFVSFGCWLLGPMFAGCLWVTHSYLRFCMSKTEPSSSPLRSSHSGFPGQKPGFAPSVSFTSCIQSGTKLPNLPPRSICSMLLTTAPSPQPLS